MSITGPAIPSAPNAYQGIEIFPVALALKSISTAVKVWPDLRLNVKFPFVGSQYEYWLIPHGYERSGAAPQNMYYVAHNVRNARSEYCVGPGRVKDFQHNGKLFAWAAGLLYGVNTEPHPSAVEIVVALRLARAGKPWQATKAHMRAVGKMWKDPFYVLAAAAEVSVISSVGKNKPKLRSGPKVKAKVCVPGLIVSPIYRVSHRDIVVVNTTRGRRVFYRSTGTSSGEPGRWFPIDEIWPINGWFNKEAYVGPGLEKGKPLHRLGNAEHHEISKRLGEMHVPRGHEVPGGALENNYVTMNRIMDFFDVQRTPTTAFRPVPE